MGLNSGGTHVCVFKESDEKWEIVVVVSCVFVSLLTQETINTMHNIFIAPTEAAQIISAAGDTLSVPAPVVQHEESIKADRPATGEGKPKPATSGS